jgi:hypothetical protein
LLGMSEYAQRFAENKINMPVLRHLTDQDLKDIGVSLGHRRKMLAAKIASHLARATRTPSRIASGSSPASAERDRERFGRCFVHWSILFSKSSRWSNRLCQNPAIWLVQSISGAKAPSCAV